MSHEFGALHVQTFFSDFDVCVHVFSKKINLPVDCQIAAYERPSLLVSAPETS